MDITTEFLAAVLRHSRDGNLTDAERLCQAFLGTNPTSGEGWNLRAGIARQAGRLELAIQYGQRAVEFLPESAEAHSDLGTSLLMLGRIDEAATSLRNAVKLKPSSEVLHFNLGNALRAKQEYDEAIGCYRRAIELNPRFSAAYCNLAAAQHEAGQFGEALLSCRELLFQNPQHANGYAILGNVYKSIGQIENAFDAYEKALLAEPNLVEALMGLASVYVLQGQVERAIPCCLQALQLHPNHSEAYTNLGTALEHTGNLQDALACFSRAIELNQDNAIAHFNRSGLLLLSGDFERGWIEHEWRWKTDQVPERHFVEPRWKGESLQNRTILLYAEQGFGDTIQFIRYAALVKRLGAVVVFECPQPLRELLSTCPGIDTLIVQGEGLPAFDFQVPLLSLPCIMKSTSDEIPADVPYLSAERGLIDAWHAKLQDLQGFRIGINWRGRGGRVGHQKRDVPVEFFLSLANIPGVRLVSLQKNALPEELAAISGRATIVDVEQEFDEKHGAFVDSSAIMRNLDLVISSDTSVPHLAGALGVPVWILLPFLPDWRWQLKRADSPWYPTMRIFRQPKAGDWRRVFEQIQQRLAALLERRGWVGKKPWGTDEA